MIVFANTTCDRDECCLAYFIQIVKCSFHTDFDCGWIRLPDQNRGVTAGMTGQQDVLIPPRHLMFPDISVCHILNFVFIIRSSFL